MRDLVGDDRDFGGQRRLKTRPDARQIGGIGKIQRPDHAVDHRNGDLEPQTFGQHTFLAQGAEDEIRGDRIARVAETRAGIAEPHPIDARLHLELPEVVTAARQQLLDAIDRFRPAYRFQIEVAVENLIAEPIDPGAALADLAIRQRGKIRRQRAAKGPHDLFDRIQRHATHKKKTISHRPRPFRHVFC